MSTSATFGDVTVGAAHEDLVQPLPVMSWLRAWSSSCRHMVTTLHDEEPVIGRGRALSSHVSR